MASAMWACARKAGGALSTAASAASSLARTSSVWPTNSMDARAKADASPSRSSGCPTSSASSSATRRLSTSSASPANQFSPRSVSASDCSPSAAKKCACRRRASFSAAQSLELFAGELADRLQHPVAAARLAGALSDKALVEQRLQRVERRAADLLGGLERAAAGEDAQPRERAPARPRRAGRTTTRSWPAASAGVGRRRADLGAGRAARRAARAAARARRRPSVPPPTRSPAAGGRAARTARRRAGRRRRPDRRAVPGRGTARRRRRRTAAAPARPARPAAAAARGWSPAPSAVGPGSRAITVGHRGQQMLGVVEQQQRSLAAQLLRRASPSARCPAARERRAPARPRPTQATRRAAAPAAPSRFRPGMTRAVSAAACTASRVLPVPPGPVKRQQPHVLAAQQLHDARPAPRSRPRNGVAGTGRLVRYRLFSGGKSPSPNW